MCWVKFIFSLLITIALTAVCLIPIDPLPISLGALFDPSYGFWQNAEPVAADSTLQLDLTELEVPVQVVIDEQEIPHLFAENDHDLYFAQGYLTARERLWQMDFLSRLSGGYLAEVLGAGPDSAILKQDRYRRRKGMVYAAKRNLERIQANPRSAAVLEAYVAGVNAYIAQLQPQDHPLEYKLMGYEPQPWTELRTCLLYVLLAEDLTGNSSDLAYTWEVMLWGKETFARLHPDYPYDQDPILSEKLTWPRPSRLMTPPTPLPTEPYAPDSLLMTGMEGSPQPATESVVGSNNWAIAPQHSATQHALLANDPHLGLNLPSIWYEQQIQAPGVNTYGVTLPGTPGVILGFNDSLAWGFTNAGFDVLDHYRIFYTNDERRAYEHDNQELPVRNRVEVIEVRDQAPFRDTVRYTHHGPVMYDQEYGDYAFPIAVQWTAHEPADNIEVMYRLNRSQNAEALIAALESFVCPAQSIAYADHLGQIGLIQAGKVPNRWPEQGRFLLDGRLRSHNWQGWIPYAMMPQKLNPEEGYIGSANQQPTEPGQYPYYYAGRYEEFRSRRLYDLLGRTDTMPLGIEEMKDMQLDNLGLIAADILPLMLQELDSAQWERGPAAQVYDSLANWDYLYLSHRGAPMLFERWWSTLYAQIWRDDYGATGQRLRLPDRAATIGILRDSAQFGFYGQRGVADSVDRHRLINRTFAQMVDTLVAQYPDPAQWRWSTRKRTSIRHLSQVFSPFHRDTLVTNGSGGILNAATYRNGPSWRLIASMSSPVEAYGLYPGGQSGNPGSARYDSYIEAWRTGRYRLLWLMTGPGDERHAVQRTISLHPQAQTSPEL